MRFRLSLQVSNVRRLIESPRNVWMTAHLPEEVRRFRESYPYGWQVAGTTLSNLFREDEEKVSAGHTRTLTRSEDSFWREWLRGPVPVVMRPVHQLPTDLRALICRRCPSRCPRRRSTWSSSTARGGRTRGCTATFDARCRGPSRLVSRQFVRTRVPFTLERPIPRKYLLHPIDKELLQCHPLG